LLDNASKYSDDQPVDVSLVPSADGTVTLRIRDHGIGISPSDAARIFDPFYRGANARAYRGNGIGLALTQRILALHAATVALDPAPAGTTGTEAVVKFAS
jgi:signal transduction histidine kinase